MGGQGYICGALSGGIIAIGLKHGRNGGSNISSKEKSYALGRELFKRFIEEFGSINCFELTGCDFTTSEGKEKISLIYSEKCVKYVDKVINIVLESK